MLEELRRVAARQRADHHLRSLVFGCKRLLSEPGASNSLSIARQLVERIGTLDDAQLDAFFDYLSLELGPDPQRVLQAAQAFAEEASAQHLRLLTEAAEPPRQELLRRLNRTPGGTAMLVRMRRALLRRLARQPEWMALEADLLHLFSSWFNPGFLELRRVDWNSPARLLERIIHHEAVHTIDGWNDLRRRLQPDRRCFAFFHPQLPDEPLIFVEVALLADMPGQIAPLIDETSPALAPERWRVAAFYGISNCEPGLRNVSLGNFLIKSVAEQLQRELPQLRSFCTLSPVPAFASWLRAGPDFAALPGLRRRALADCRAAHARLLALCGGDLAALQRAASHDSLDPQAVAALRTLCAVYLLQVSPTPDGDPVARFHLGNGARLERLNVHGNMSAAGLKQSFGIMVNYRYDLAQIEANHQKFEQGEVARSRAVLSAR